MARQPLRFRETDVQRAVKAARAVGLEPSRMEIAPDGTIRLDFGKDAPADLQPFDAWRTKRAASS